MKLSILNFVLFQLGWFACVLGGANGLPWLGLVVVAVLATLHLTLIKPGRREGLLLLAALAGGFIADFLVVVFGFMSFPEHARLGAPLALWMPMMWVNFATTLNVSMKWLLGRYWLSVAFGAVGGPLAYYTGARLGAIELSEPTWQALAVIAIEWAMAMPLLLLVAARLAPKGTATALTSVAPASTPKDQP